MQAARYAALVGDHMAFRHISLSGQVADEPKKAGEAGGLEQTIAKLESDNKDLKERVLRSLAEVENMRMR